MKVGTSKKSLRWNFEFQLLASDVVDHDAAAEFSFETNAAPVGGHVYSDMLDMTSGQDKVLLQTIGWVDDFEDLPMAYEFGYASGWHEVDSVFR